MRHSLRLSALLAMALVTATSSAFAQNTGAAVGAGGVAPGMGGVPPVGTTTTNPGSVGISSAPGDHGYRHHRHGHRLEYGHQSGPRPVPTGRAEHDDSRNDRYGCRAKRFAGR
jgi:hypothetical protein